MKEMLTTFGAGITIENANSLSEILFNSKKIASPFLLLRYPGHTITLASCDSSSQSTFSFAPFHNGDTLFLSDFKMIGLENLDTHKLFKDGRSKESETLKSVEPVDKQSFIGNVILAKTEIEKGKFKKVVLSKTKKINQSVNPIHSFIRLEEKYQTALVYCFYHPKCGIWIGASPEKLLEKDKESKFHIHSLAGTKAISEDWTKKEIVEQKIVTDYITNKLINIGAKNLEVDGPMDYEFGDIKHIKSSIHFQIDHEFQKIIAAIHPTPAVCGMPLLSSQKFILDHEGYDRSYYTGHIGLRNIDDIHDTYFVNLRCMQVNKDNTYIYTGAGIVSDSDPEREWEEVEAKAKTLIDCITIYG
tara:strand:+ start:294 stop:1370 length:1077 start_codon:yes stop_codon:yes gene_type:complete